GWGFRDDLDPSYAFYDFHVQLRVKFKQGNQAGWIFRAQPDKRKGYVFLLEKRGSRLLLNSWVYSDHKPVRLGKEDTDLDFEGPFDVEDYWDIDVDVKNNEFRYAFSFWTDNLPDDLDQDPRIKKNSATFPVTPFKDEVNTYRFGNIGFFAPEGSQVIVDNYVFKPLP